MKSSSSAKISGFHLIEVMIVTVIVGILAGIAVPSMLSQKRELKGSVKGIQTLVKTVNLSARANSGNPYRINVANTGKTFASGQQEQYLKVEFLPNGSCTNSVLNEVNSPWRHDVKKDFVLPESIKVQSFPAPASASAPDSKGICFNGRGETSSITNGLMVTDVQQQNNAVVANINVSKVGDVSRQAYDKNYNLIPGGTMDQDLN
jgi:prepilin-type N-terminal cleavage/methylation domain-containing protein